jgi:YD repeat-containing protein
MGAFQTNSQPPPPSQAPTGVSLTQVLVSPSLFGETVTLTAQVSSPAGPVHEGTVTFSVAGHSVVASVNASGQATAQLSLPMLTTITPLAVDVSYADNGAAFAGSSSVGTPRYILTDGLLPSTTKPVAAGSQTVADDFFGLLSLSRSYDAQGRLTEVDIDGIPVETFGYNGQGQLAMVGVLGIQAPLAFGLPPQLADVLFQESLGLPLGV